MAPDTSDRVPLRELVLRVEWCIDDHPAATAHLVVAGQTLCHLADDRPLAPCPVRPALRCRLCEQIAADRLVELSVLIHATAHASDLTEQSEFQRGMSYALGGYLAMFDHREEPSDV